jgi:hypothetical protein
MEATSTQPNSHARIATAVRFTLEHDHSLTDGERNALRQVLRDRQDLDELTALARSGGLGEEQLDDLVDAAVGQYASTVNSEGLEAQLAMLLAALGSERARGVLDSVMEEAATSRLRVGAAR